MPIRAENRSRYPKEWPLISLWVRVCAGWRCEWCAAEQGEPHPDTGSRVVLTVAHLDHESGPEDVRPSNLAALCQRCHLRHDAPLHARNSAVRRRLAFGTPDLLMGDAQLRGRAHGAERVNPEDTAR